MIDQDALHRAAHLNDAVVGESGGPAIAPADAMNGDLGIEMMDLLMVGFDYACQQTKEEHKDLREMLHTAWVFGAITMARAIRTEQREQQASKRAA